MCGKPGSGCFTIGTGDGDDGDSAVRFLWGKAYPSPVRQHFVAAHSQDQYASGNPAQHSLPVWHRHFRLQVYVSRWSHDVNATDVEPDDFGDAFKHENIGRMYFVGYIG